MEEQLGEVTRSFLFVAGDDGFVDTVLVAAGDFDSKEGVESNGFERV